MWCHWWRLVGIPLHLLWAHLHGWVGGPACVSVGIPELLWLLVSTHARHDCFMRTSDATPHGVVACRLVVVKRPRARAGCTVVRIVDVGAVRVAVVHVRKSFDRMWGCHLCCGRASREVLVVVPLLPSSSTITSTSATPTSLMTIVIVVIVLLGWWWVHWWGPRWWLCHDGVTHLLEIGELPLQVVDCVCLSADTFFGGGVCIAEGRDCGFEGRST